MKIILKRMLNIDSVLTRQLSRVTEISDHYVHNMSDIFIVFEYNSIDIQIRNGHNIYNYYEGKSKCSEAPSESGLVEA